MTHYSAGGITPEIQNLGTVVNIGGVPEMEWIGLKWPIWLKAKLQDFDTEHNCVGDVVFAYNARADYGRGALAPRNITRLYRNTTQTRDSQCCSFDAR